MPRCVVVTGASGAIGCAIAKAFAMQNNYVVLGYHKNKFAADAAVYEFQSAGKNATAIQVDVTSEQQVSAFIKEAQQHYGAIDVLVNCAGTAQQKLFTDISLDEWNSIFNVNVTGTFLCCREVLPSMISRKSGCIINISSMWGQVGAACEAHYAATKAAVIGLSQSLAKEEAPSGIRVNCIAPGAIQSEMLSGLSGETLALLREEIPMGRLGTPEEIAGTALFLASPAAGYITGQTISPNGGMVL